MARIEPVTSRDQIAEGERQFWDEILNRRGEFSGPSTYFLHSPQMTSIYSQLADYVRIHGLLNPGQVRLVSLLVSRFYDCEYIWAVNLPHVPQTGPSDIAVETIGRGGDLSKLPGEEAILAQFIDELLREHRISDGAYEAVVTRLGVQATMELIGVISIYTMIAYMVNAFEVEPPPGTPRFP